MSTKQPGTVFHSDFLKTISKREPLSLTTLEATWAGPWAVTPSPKEGELKEFSVHRIGDSIPVAITRFRETAFLLAASLPAAGRGQLYWTSPEEDPDNPERKFKLMTILGEQGLTTVGAIQRRHEEILGPLSTVDHVVRSPASLAYLILAAPVEALEQAGNLIMHQLRSWPE